MCDGCDKVPREYCTFVDPSSGFALCQCCSEERRGDGSEEEAIRLNNLWAEKHKNQNKLKRGIRITDIVRFIASVCAGFSFGAYYGRYEERYASHLSTNYWLLSGIGYLVLSFILVVLMDIIIKKETNK